MGTLSRPIREFARVGADEGAVGMFRGYGNSAYPRPEWQASEQMAAMRPAAPAIAT